METAINSQAKVPCSQLDGSFLPNGIVTSMCTNGSTWGPLDMSQCTFRNDASVAAVAVIEVMPLVEDSFWNMEVRMNNICSRLIFLHARAANTISIIYTQQWLQL